MLTYLENEFAAKSPREIFDAAERIASAKGEMIYAISFAQKAGMKEDKLTCFQNAAKSFDNLGAQVNILSNLRTISLNITLFALTLISVFFYFLNGFNGGEHPMALAFACTLAVWALIMVYEKLTTRTPGKQKPSPR